MLVGEPTKVLSKEKPFLVQNFIDEKTRMLNKNNMLRIDSMTQN